MSGKITHIICKAHQDEARDSALWTRTVAAHKVHLWRQVCVSGKAGHWLISCTHQHHTGPADRRTAERALLRVEHTRAYAMEAVEKPGEIAARAHEGDGCGRQTHICHRFCLGTHPLGSSPVKNVSCVSSSPFIQLPVGRRRPMEPKMNVISFTATNEAYFHTGCLARTKRCRIWAGVVWAQDRKR